MQQRALDRFEYIRIHIKNIPKEIIEEYNLMDLVAPGSYVYIEIRQAMNGLGQSMSPRANQEL